MLEMLLPVDGVLPDERNIMNGQEGFGVLLLGRLGEIEASRTVGQSAAAMALKSRLRDAVSE